MNATREARKAADAKGGLVYEIAERRICWPEPDATCLHGGCGWCNDHRFRPLPMIERYARRAGFLPHRGKGVEDALAAYRYGLQHAFFNVETRASRAALEEFATTVPLEALRAMAEGMGGVHEAKRHLVQNWLLRHRRHVLDDSLRIESEARRR